MRKLFFLLFFFILVNFNYLHALDVKEINYYKDKKAWLVNDNNLPIIAIKLAFKAGSGLDPIGKKGLANMTVSLLDEGAGNYSAKEFKRILADNSITLNFNVSHDNFYINLYTLKENLDLSFQLLDLALTKPTFKLEEINRIKGNIKLVLEQSYKDPDAIGTRLFREILFVKFNHALWQCHVGTRLAKLILINFFGPTFLIHLSIDHFACRVSFICSFAGLASRSQTPGAPS